MVERLCGYGARVADCPDPDGPHEHLYHRHLLARAHGRGPTEAPGVGAVACVICGTVTTIEPAPRPSAEQVWASQPAGGGGERDALDLVGIELVEVVGHIQGAWATSQRGAWRVSIGGRIVFARQSDGCTQALQAAARAGDQVCVAARRIRADLWADAVHRC